MIRFYLLAVHVLPDNGASHAPLDGPFHLADTGAGIYNGLWLKSAFQCKDIDGYDQHSRNDKPLQDRIEVISKWNHCMEEAHADSFSERTSEKQK